MVFNVGNKSATIVIPDPTKQGKELPDQVNTSSWESEYGWGLFKC